MGQKGQSDSFIARPNSIMERIHRSKVNHDSRQWRRFATPSQEHFIEPRCVKLADLG